MIIVRKLGLSVAVAVLLCLAAARFAHPAPSPGVSPEDASRIMPVSQLKRGMRGYGLTVFQGTKIEKFDVEILGVMKKMNMGKDLILARIGGGPITSRRTAIIAGMSGSPVYINGKVVGAVAYGGQFSREPIGMLTPIEDMLEAWDPNLPKQASGYSSPQPLAQPLSFAGKTVRQIAIDRTGSRTGTIEDGVMYMQPLMTPLMVSGMSQRGISMLADILRPYNIMPVAGPGGAGKEGITAQLEPGAAVGMSLASGDIDLTGIGTLTYRRGNRIVAMGHPMLSVGAIDAPMTTAFVDDILPSYQVSTKMASPIKTVGRIFQDRPFSVAGMVGPMPRTIPVTVRVDDQAYKRSRTYKVNVIDHPLLASRLITMVADEAMYEMHPAPGDATAEVTYEIEADQVGKIKRTNVFFSPTAVDLAAMADVGTLLRILSANQFHPLDIKSVKMDVKITDKRNTASIDRIFVKESEYEPGETVEVGVVLRPYKKDRVTRTFSIKIPATATDGKVSLVVRGGGSAGTGPSGSAPVDGSQDDEVAPSLDTGLAYADNVKQMVARYLEKEKNNEIVLQLQMRGTAVNIGGEKLAGLPAAIADVMKSSRNSGLRMEREEVKEVYQEEMIITGSARLTIDVKKKSLNEAPSSSTGGPPPSVSGARDSGSSPTSDSDGMIIYDYLVDDATELSAMTSDDSVTITEETLEAAELDEPEPPKPSPSPVTPPKTADKAASTAPTPKTDVKTVVRQTTTWTQKTQADFAKGTFYGVSASSDNELQLAPTLRKLVETPEQFVWCLAPAKDGVYAGTGNSGRIYHISDSGEAQVFYETGELEVHALAVDATGNVYAGTSPHGKVFKIAADGKAQLLAQAEERYVLALAIDPEGSVYAAVGDAGKIYRIQPDGSIGLFANLNEQQVLSLHWDAGGSLLAGTGINGVVYRIDRSGRASPIFDAPESAITSLVRDAEGNVYAGTSPKGVVYKIAPDGSSKSVYSKASRVLSMAVDQRNLLYAVSDGSLARIAPDETVVNLDSGQDKVQFLALSYNPHTEALYAGTGNVGSVYMSKCCDVRGTFESAVHDTKLISRWGRIKWVAQTPEGTSVAVRTRVGNVETPDSTWTDWSAPYTSSAGEQMAGPAARYVQYQVALTTQKPEVSPRVSAVSISYLTPNQQPTVKLSAPLGGEVWSAKETIKWVGSDPDKDTLTYDVFYSKDAGKTWTALVGGMGAGESGDKKPSDAEITEKVKSELEKSPDVPDDMKKAVLKDEKGAAARHADSKPAEAKSSTSTSYTWDTSKVEDGTYIIKVVASDKTSNATGALTKESISQPFTICNKAPKLVVRPKRTLELEAAGPATIVGMAMSELVEVSGVQYRVDGGDWAAAAADDGMFDSPIEGFTVTTGSLAVGAHKVQVQAVDAAGNAASSTVEVKVTEGKS